MSFNADVTKQTQKIASTRKKNDTSHPRLHFDNAQIQRQSVQKHLGIFSDGK